jgi:hypothetical protein
MSEIIDRITYMSPDRDDLIRLLEDIQNEGLLVGKCRRKILSKSKDYLLFEIDWLSDYRPLLRFIDVFPALVSSNEKAALAKSFVPLARKNILRELISKDPDTLRYYAAEVQDIGGQVGANVTKLVNDIEKRALSLEKHVEDTDEDRGESNEPPSESESCSDGEIESIFVAFK